MLTKVVVVLTVFASAVFAGEEPPPPKAHHYNVPNVAKVTYPGPSVTKSVETYSAPSIEKTTTITRTITAPLNAPAVKQVHYSAPAPVLPAPGYAAVSAPGLALGGFGYAGGAGHAGIAPGITQYSAPQLGYNVAQVSHGGPAVYAAPAPAFAFAAAPAEYAAPAAYAHAAPVAAAYGAPAPGKGGY